MLNSSCRTSRTASVAEKATKCYADAEKHPWRMAECERLSERFDALQKRTQAKQQRAQAEQFCKDKGLRFKGTIGDQVECEP